MTARYVAPNRDVDLQGHYAGSVSRLLAWVIDAFTVAAIYALLLALSRLAIEVVTGQSFEPSDIYSWLATAMFLLWSLLYFAFPWAMSGKTVGMAVLGVQVRRTDGSLLNGKRAIVRAVTLPLSFLLLGIGLIMGLFQRQNRCLHDFFADTVVLYSWDARRARLRLLTREDVDPAGEG
ncbi:MAG: RDD family protein [Ilumatobacteraceae bacterium]